MNAEATVESKPATNDNYPLCRYDELAERSAKPIELQGVGADGAIESCPLIVVRWDDKVYGYLNNCPHTPVQLDARVPGQLLNAEQTYLMCDKHGALFEIDSGECYEGPCQGKSLTPLKVDVVDGSVCLMGVKLIDVDETPAK